MIKSNPCKLCSSIYHTAAFCPQKPKKAIKRSPLKATARFAPVSKPRAIIKKKPIKKKAQSRSQLVKKLDKVFSEYIRLRYSQDGISTCVTCGDQKPWREHQNGHYFSRGRQNTRWDEDNCAVQCMRCNIFLKGNYTEYSMYMIEKYGLEFVKQLQAKSKSTEKITTVTIKEMIEYYTKVVNNYLQT